MLVTRTLELRLDPAESESTIVRGYAAVFDQLSVDMWGMQERIRPGAFRESLGSITHDILALWSHDPSKPLASRSANTLTLREDKHGLAFEMDLSAGMSWVRDAHAAIRSGVISKMSIGFSVMDDDWATEGGKTIRSLKNVDLYEVSPVAFPAYAGTEAEARDLKSAYEKHIAQTGAASGGETRSAGVDIDLLLAINQSKRRIR